MTARRIRRMLESTPVDAGAEERAWRVVRTAFAEREPLPRRRVHPVRPALALAVVAAALAAAAASPAGRAVVDAVRRSIGIEHAAPALFRLPAPGRLLVAGGGGAWVVAQDGSKRLLGDYYDASWSPHGLYVVAVRKNELAALDPGGRVHWTLARPTVRFPRWGGSRTDTRIAYFSAGRLRVVAGDGTGDRPLCGARATPQVAPVWTPGPGHVLAYATVGQRVRVVDTDTCTTRWLSPRLAPFALAVAADGTLAVANPRGVVLVDARRRMRLLRVPGVHALAFSRDGRLALVTRGSVRVGSRTLLAGAPGLGGVAWSPDGRWLVVSWPSADQWILLRTRGTRRILAVSRIASELGGTAALGGWVDAAPAVP